MIGWLLARGYWITLQGLVMMGFASCKNQMVIDAVIRNIEVLGEAAKRVSEELRRRYSGIEWRESQELGISSSTSASVFQ